MPALQVDLGALSKLTSLESLDLSFCDFSSGPGLTATLRSLPKLRTLRLTGTRLPHDKFKPGYLPSTESFDIIGVPQLEVRSRLLAWAWAMTNLGY